MKAIIEQSGTKLLRGIEQLTTCALLEMLERFTIIYALGLTRRKGMCAFLPCISCKYSTIQMMV